MYSAYTHLGGRTTSAKSAKPNERETVQGVYHWHCASANLASITRLVLDPAVGCGSTSVETHKMMTYILQCSSDIEVITDTRD